VAGLDLLVEVLWAERPPGSAVAAYARGSCQQALQDLESSLAMFESVGDRQGASRARQVLGGLRQQAAAPS
jgi:hypothetical protein